MGYSPLGLLGKRGKTTQNFLDNPKTVLNGQFGCAKLSTSYRLWASQAMDLAIIYEYWFYEFKCRLMEIDIAIH